MKNWSIDSLQETWYLVSKLHQGQKYGGDEEGQQIEYINHIGSVVFEIIQSFEHDKTMNADFSLTCALLHDTIEDTQITYDKIRDLFGVQVANAVNALSKDSTIKDKALQMENRICNLYAPPYYWTLERKTEYHKESILIYDALKEGNTYLASRLKEKIDNYKQFF
ncbi:HD domain-containing protein [Flavobacterium psychroterrae]|uniref:HD domain-containing protein n=1 Tax=Flavobacterium psychroterrae TaxID=2133767 RepID=A0ABS5PFF8_9FLAO|nr:HD domain-containing protein [Flavobacterium psychroterrae]MBS7233039.1 HD domain-containing protein [Flavobacterium psychroterrae]